jgi:hypothetical protein
MLLEELVEVEKSCIKTLSEFASDSGFATVHVAEEVDVQSMRFKRLYFDFFLLARRPVFEFLEDVGRY